MMNTLRRSKLLCGLLCVTALVCCAEGIPVPISVQVHLDRDDIIIGDLFTLVFEIKNTTDIVLDEFDPAEALASFEIKDFKIKGPRKRFGRETRTYTYELSTFLSGIYEIPSFDIPYHTIAGKKSSISSPPLRVDIKPVARKEGEPDDIRDIKPVRWVPVSTWGIIVLSAVCAGVIGIWIMVYLRRRRKMLDLTGAFLEQVPPDENACRRLDALNNLNLIAEGRVQEWYIIVAEIIRQYLSSRFSITVLDKTTLELYKDLREKDETRKYAAVIKDFLMQCDLVKFAKYIPEKRIIDEDLLLAYDIIDQTRSRPFPAPDQEKMPVRAVS